MQNESQQPTRLLLWFLTFLVFSLLLLGLAGCGKPNLTPTPEGTVVAVPSPTTSPPPRVDLPPLPVFRSAALLPGVQPSTYITDTCEYLMRRWDPNNSAPGTIVVPVMYHSVGKRKNRGDGDTWTPTPYFNKTMAEAERLGYQTVTTAQLIGFLEQNERIPPRSLLLMVDDRRLSAVEDHFLPVLERNNWTLTLGWISNPESRPDTWQRLDNLVRSSGRLDVQAHGYKHQYMIESTPLDTIREEIVGPISVLMEHFGKRPLAFIWPGGNYTAKTVRTARQAGYKLGFTVHSRGPLMYNSIPQGGPERAIKDPLLLLPRYWGYPGMLTQLGDAAAIGDEARKSALAAYQDEANYYRTYCGGELPAPAP